MILGTSKTVKSKGMNAHSCCRERLKATCDVATTSTLLVLDWKFFAGRTLVLSADEVGDLLIFGLLNGRLVTLVASTHILLNIIDSYKQQSPLSITITHKMKG